MLLINLDFGTLPVTSQQPFPALVVKDEAPLLWVLLKYGKEILFDDIKP